MLRRSFVGVSLILAACGGKTEAPESSGPTGQQVLDELAQSSWYFGLHSAAGFGDEEYWTFSAYEPSVVGRFVHYDALDTSNAFSDEEVGSVTLPGDRLVELSWEEPLHQVQGQWFTGASYELDVSWDGTTHSGLWLTTQAYVKHADGSYRSRYGVAHDDSGEDTRLSLRISPTPASITTTSACSLELSFTGSVTQDGSQTQASGALSYAAVCTPVAGRYVDIRSEDLDISDWYLTAKAAVSDAPDTVGPLFGRVYASELLYDRGRDLILNTAFEHTRERGDR